MPAEMTMNAVTAERAKKSESESKRGVSACVGVLRFQIPIFSHARQLAKAMSAVHQSKRPGRLPIL
jgi:hypothetical protein